MYMVMPSDETQIQRVTVNNEQNLEYRVVVAIRTKLSAKYKN